MLTSLAIIFLLGMSLGSIFKKMKLPSLLGMLITGIIISPYALNLLDPSIIAISAELRQIALVIILMRAGLSLKLSDLKKVGRPAILMCFLPAIFELTAVIVFAPMFLDITVLEAAIMGSVLAAVSPAVIVPKMIKIKEEGFGEEKSIPQLIMASASVDDIFVIVLFTTFIGLIKGEGISVMSFFQIPLSIITGLATGIILGILIAIFFKKVHIRDSIKVVILLSISFLFIGIQERISGFVPFSGLLAIMSMGATVQNRIQTVAERIQVKFSKLWVAAEIILFVLVGATVDMKYAVSAGLFVILLIFIALLFRMLGVFLCLINTKFTKKERLFCILSYIPKATVQAAIGAIPLSMNLDCGHIILAVAVISILITAPLGALGIDFSYSKLLSKKCS